MSFSSPWWAGSYKVDSTGISVIAPRWIPKPIVEGLDGRVILSRWWGLEWWAPEMPASEFNALLVLIGDSVAVTTPSQASPDVFTTYSSAILTGADSDGQFAHIVKDARIKFRVYV